jgi:hypothetical protein
VIERATALTNNRKSIYFDVKSYSKKKIINFFLKFKTSSLIYHLVHIFFAVVNFFFLWLFFVLFIIFCLNLFEKRRGKTKELWLLMLLWNSRPIFMLVSCFKFLHFHFFLNRWIGWIDTTNKKNVFFTSGVISQWCFKLRVVFEGFRALT